MIYRVIDITSPEYTDSLYQSAYSRMSSERQAKADRYKFLEDRRRCVFADYLLREMLAQFPEARDKEIYTDKNGKPHLEGDTLYFSLSHSGNYVACAIDCKAVGIDLETPRKPELKLIDYVCTDSERSYVLSGTDAETLSDEEASRFLRVWTAKEAYLKYTGEGLRGGMKNITVANNRGMLKTLPDGQTLTTLSTEEYTLSIVTD